MKNRTPRCPARYEWLRKVRRAARVQANHKVVQPAHQRILAGRQSWSSGIPEKVALPMCSSLPPMLCTIRQPRPARASGRSTDLLDRRIEQNRCRAAGIMAAGAPLGRTHAGNVLHVLDAFPVPSVVEGGEMVHRAVPLLINIRMARWQASDFMKYLRNVPPCLVCASGEKLSLEAVTFAVHCFRASADWRWIRASSRRPRVHPCACREARRQCVSAANPKPRWTTPSPSHPSEKSLDVARKSMPTTHNVICALQHNFSRRGVPILIQTRFRGALCSQRDPAQPGQKRFAGEQAYNVKNEENVKTIPIAM